MPNQQSLVRYKILIIEDDTLLANMFAKVLSGSGYDVSVLYSGENAVEQAQQNKIDLIFLDIMMPQKSGFEVLKELKLNNDTKNTPVILLTNLGDIDNIDKGLGLGAADYALKANIDIHRILDLTDKHLIHRNARYNTRQDI